MALLLAGSFAHLRAGQEEGQRRCRREPHLRDDGADPARARRTWSGSPRRARAPSPETALPHALLLASTGLVTAVPLICFGAAAIRVSMTTIGLLQYLAPTIQFVLGLLVFDEQMTPVEVGRLHPRLGRPGHLHQRDPAPPAAPAAAGGGGQRGLRGLAVSPVPCETCTSPCCNAGEVHSFARGVLVSEVRRAKPVLASTGSSQPRPRSTGRTSAPDGGELRPMRRLPWTNSSRCTPMDCSSAARRSNFGYDRPRPRRCPARRRDLPSPARRLRCRRDVGRRSTTSARHPLARPGGVLTHDDRVALRHTSGAVEHGLRLWGVDLDRRPRGATRREVRAPPERRRLPRGVLDTGRDLREGRDADRRCRERCALETASL